ncbi:MAG: hypothetical protein AAF958_10405 [Planctomycetota bacterium]
MPRLRGKLLLGCLATSLGIGIATADRVHADSPRTTASLYHDPALRPAPKLGSQRPGGIAKSSGQAWKLRWTKPQFPAAQTSASQQPASQQLATQQPATQQPTTHQRAIRPPSLPQYSLPQHSAAQSGIPQSGSLQRPIRQAGNQDAVRQVASLADAVRRHGIQGRAAESVQVRQASHLQDPTLRSLRLAPHTDALPMPDPAKRVRLVDARVPLPLPQDAPESGPAGGGLQTPAENPFAEVFGASNENPLRGGDAKPSDTNFNAPDAFSTPNELGAPNEFGAADEFGASDEFGAPEEFDAPGAFDPPADANTAPSMNPAPSTDTGPSSRDLLDQNNPLQDGPNSPSDLNAPSSLNAPSDGDFERLPPPKDRDGMLSDAFGDVERDRSSDRASDIDRDEMGLDGGDGENPFDEQGVDGPSKRESLIKDCDDFREKVLGRRIDQISLDPSPPFRPDEINQERFEKLKKKFDLDQPVRQWRSVSGEVIASGALRDLAYGRAVLENEGVNLTVELDRLSEGDLAYIGENWGLPGECLLPQQTFKPRAWKKLTMTWQASNLVHKSVYFDDVNLERYGHTHGPWQEPLVQTAHFFGNVLILPYKMGMNPPEECHYTLGYYRPGSCAPWIVPPVPISARGALTQAAVMTGGTLLIP